MSDGRFEVIAYPTVYNAKRIGSLPEVHKVVRDCQVALRGWYFPHIQRDAATSFSQGFESVTRTGPHLGGFRLYQSGLFVWRETFWEDRVEETWLRTSEMPRLRQGQRLLSFISTIWSFTEFSLFLARLYERVAPDSTVRVVIRMKGCRGRELAAFDAMVPFFGGYISQEDVISQERELQVVELRASHASIAAEMVKHVFHVFNWLDAADSMIAGWQEKLLKKQF